MRKDVSSLMGDQVVGLGDLSLNPRSLDMLKALLGVGKNMASFHEASRSGLD